MCGPMWNGQLLAWGHEGMCHGNPLLHHAQVSSYDVLKPPVRVMQGDKQDMLQLLGLPTCAWVAGCHGKVWAGRDTEACASHNEGRSFWGSFRSLGLSMGEGVS